MESNHDKKGDVTKKPSEVETVERLITRKKTEKEAEGREAVLQKAEGVQTEVADVMAGVEAPKEGVSDKKGETGERRDITGGAQQTQDQKAQAAAAFAARRGLPTQEIMIKKIRAAITEQIKLELRKAKTLEKNLAAGSAQEYSSAIAKVRRLQEALKSLLTSTFEAIKSLYFKYFSPDGHRKPMDEV
ncbi:hypothetical protein KKA04_00005 [Patescibacteria group bacterium]|nr:hypothetical protein [Patescibacteria group bacterium]